MIKICVITCDMNSILGSVVPLAMFYCVLINHRTFPGMPWALRTVLFQFLSAQIFFCVYTNQPLNLSRYALDARLAIAITANFVNNW